MPQARLTLPLSNRVIKPFVVPDDIFRRFSLDDEQIFSYNFIDPLIWLEKFSPNYYSLETILKPYQLDLKKPLIVIREEEYKASYVDKQYPILYDAMYEIAEMTQANIVIIPRYESQYLKEKFPYVTVLEEKVAIQHLLAYADLFIGGGGTLNTEACYFGTPTISTRSFISHYDKYQIDHGLMEWVSSKEELLDAVKRMISQRYDAKAKAVFGSMNVDIAMMTKAILA